MFYEPRQRRVRECRAARRGIDCSQNWPVVGEGGVGGWAEGGGGGGEFPLCHVGCVQQNARGGKDGIVGREGNGR